nr:hypothetical protein [Mycobacterium riyadhense]
MARHRRLHRPSLQNRRAFDTLFSQDAIGLIHNASRGHPRAVNNLALHALTAAFAADHSIVDEKAARIAIAETARTESNSRQTDQDRINSTGTPSPRPPRPRSPHRAGPFS